MSRHNAHKPIVARLLRCNECGGPMAAKPPAPLQPRESTKEH